MVNPGSPQMLLATLDVLHVGLLLVDRAGRVTLCTRQARRLLSLPEQGADGVSIPHLVAAIKANAGGGWRETRAGLLRVLRREAASSFDLRIAGRSLECRVCPAPEAGWAVTIEDVSNRKAAESDAAERARLDPLTGLPNRLLLRERLEEALARYQRMGEGCALLAVDLDRFKAVNDTLGHPVGDALLNVVADRLRSTLRPTDTVARIGGDEFIILQAGIANPEDTQALARRIVDLVGRAYVVEGHLVSIGASVGVAFVPSDGLDAEKLLKNADLALYRAKTDGRGTFRFFEPEMDARMQRRRQLELDLRKALALREFHLHYQPQLNLESNQLVGCEALLRWKHPTRGMVPPLDFIPLAEEIGLIVPIGEWVVRQACRDAASWPDHMTIAVNLSPAQFKSERLVEMMASALAASGLPAHRLELEITEGVLLQDNDANLKTLHRLRALGIRVSMDDFGTGYSSLSYLRSFPFDKIKIDRSFVSDVSNRKDGDAIIRAIAGLGKSLGMTTVAEGVETADQMERIRAEGCTDIQGYHISRPVPATEIQALLANVRSAA
jgi:diguanylate cyclase (GGDEF)-like protein